jgi:hypothetical protein
LTLQINNKYDEYGYSYGQSSYSNTGNLKVSGDRINITDLYPESDNTYYLYASINGGSEYRISDIVAKTANDGYRLVFIHSSTCFSKEMDSFVFILNRFC